jgi:hypothetical protein
MNDMVLAARLDSLPVEYSPKWLAAARAGGDDVPGAPKA